MVWEERPVTILPIIVEMAASAVVEAVVEMEEVPSICKNLYEILYSLKFSIGGGGYAGGDAPSSNTTNGAGGYSFLDPTRTVPYLSDAHSGYNAGPGYVMIIGAISGCGCDYRCVALDVKRSQVACICPHGWKLDSDEKTCVRKFTPGLDVSYLDGGMFGCEFEK